MTNSLGAHNLAAHMRAGYDVAVRLEREFAEMQLEYRQVIHRCLEHDFQAIQDDLSTVTGDARANFDGDVPHSVSRMWNE